MAIEILGFLQNSGSNQNLVARLLPLVLDAVASQFELAKYSSASNRSNECTYASWPGCSFNEKGEHDSGLVVKLYQLLIQSDPKKASELLGKIRSQTEDLSHDELGRLVVPLLEQMMHTVDLCSLDGSQFFKSMIATYVKRVVQNEPAKPSDWTQPEEAVRCYRSDCSFCPSLQKFLRDPEEKTRTFITSKDLNHACYQVPYRCETKKSEDPPKITVTKTLKRWKEVHSAWQNRAARAQETLMRFPQKELKLCLGKDYDAIMDLRMVKVQDRATYFNLPQKRSRED